MNVQTHITPVQLLRLLHHVESQGGCTGRLDVSGGLRIILEAVLAELPLEPWMLSMTNESAMKWLEDKGYKKRQSWDKSLIANLKVGKLPQTQTSNTILSSQPQPEASRVEEILEAMKRKEP